MEVHSITPYPMKILYFDMIFHHITDQVEKPKRSLRPRCKAEASVLVERLSSKYLVCIFHNKLQ